MATATRRVVRTMPQMFIDVADNQSERLQVAAYARVSTEKEEQEDSFERQVEHYKQLIYSKPEWQFVDVYADPGISGTRAEKRPDFLRQGAARQTGRETAGQSRRRALILRSACPRRVSPARDARRGVFMWQL